MNYLSRHYWTENLYVNEQGELSAQTPLMPIKRPLSNKARTAANNIELSNIMEVVTGLDREQMEHLMLTLCIEFLLQHTGADEGEVYRLLAIPLVYSWWKNHWYDRDRSMCHIITHNHKKQLETLRRQGSPIKTSRRKAHLETMQKYIVMHRMALDPRFYHYRHLEDSYAKLW